MQGYATCAPNFFRIFLSYLVWRQNFCFVVLGRPESLFSPFFSTVSCTVIDPALEVHMFAFSLLFPVTPLSFLYHTLPFPIIPGILHGAGHRRMRP